MRERRDQSRDRHILMITNHGVHEWEVTPGLPDTGGQNVYVNQFTDALIEQGYRVTITSRGGYPHNRCRSPVPDLYAARLIRDRAGEWQVLGFRDGSTRGEFAGEIIDPVPLKGLDLI